MVLLGQLVGIGPDEPLFGGTAVSSDVPYPLPVALGGHAYEIDLKFYSRKTLPPLRPQSDSSQEPSEASFSPEGLWRRHQESFHFGAGQRFFDANQDSNRRRHWESKGIDPWTPFQFTLLNATRNIDAVAGSTQKVVTAPSSYLYHSSSDTVKFTADPSVASPSWTTMTGGGVGLAALWTDGTYIYGAFTTSGVVHRVALGTTAWGAAWATLAGVDNGTYVGGRVIISAVNRVAEVDAAGTVGGASQLDFSHRQPGWAWTAMMGAPNGIYIAGQAGDVSELYLITVSESSGQLRIPVYAGGLPYGELVRSLDVFGRVMAIGTNKGLRLAAISDGGALEIGPLITAPGDIRSVHIFDKFVWFSWTNYDSSSSGTGRADMSHFVEPLVPAYASDLMATTQGAVQDIATWGDRRYFTVSGVGLFAEYGDKVSSGVFESGLIRYGNFERKIPTLLDIRHEALVGTVSADLIDEQDNVFDVSTNVDQGTLGPVSPWIIQGVAGDAFAVRLTLTSNGSTGAPVIRRWTLKSIVVPQTVDEIIVPIILKARVKSDMGEGSDLHFDVFEEYQYLHNLVMSANVVTYQEGQQSEQVRLLGIEMLEPDDWADDRVWLDGILMVKVHTVIPTS